MYAQKVFLFTGDGIATRLNRACFPSGERHELFVFLVQVDPEPDYDKAKRMAVDEGWDKVFLVDAEVARPDRFGHNEHMLAAYEHAQDKGYAIHAVHDPLKVPL